MTCPGCRKRIAVTLTQLLEGSSPVCGGCGLKLQLDRSVSQRALAALQEFDRRLRQIGTAARVRRIIGAIGGAFCRVASALGLGGRQEPIVLGIGRSLVFQPDCPPVESGMVVTAKLGGLDCTLQLGRGETDGLRRLRELLETGS
jgi:hypothetical protein